MADAADKADAAIEAARVAAIEAAKANPFQHIPETGFCAWCGDPVLPGQKHCRPIHNDCAEVHLKFLVFRAGSM